MPSPPRALLPALALLVSLSACSDPPPLPTHVVVVSIDTLRPDRLGAYGHREDVSPTIDRLAREGVVFEEAIAASTWTLPSHAALFTSLWPAMLDLGRFDAPAKVSDAATTLAEVLDDAGYRTFGATAGAFVGAEFGFDQGFDTFLPPQKRFEPAVERALAWIDDGREADADAPCFVFLHTYDVHNYVATADDRRRFVAPSFRSFLATKRNLGKFLQRNDKQVCENMGDRDWVYATARYDAAVATADRTLGRFVDGLAERGMLDDTLLIVTSDHGEEFGEHGRSGHGYTVYDENVRVPLILRHPPSLPAARVPAQVPLVDVAPTVVDLLGLEPPSSWQGRTLAPLLDGDGPSRPAFVSDTHVPHLALRDDGFKYFLSSMRPHEHLYDLSSDPRERKNVVASHEERAAEALDRLARFAERAAAETRYAGAALTPSDEALRSLEQFGYLAGGSESRGDDAGPPGFDWSALIERVRREAAERRAAAAEVAEER